MIEDQPNHMNQTKNPGKTGNGQTGVSLRGVVAAAVPLPLCAVLLPSVGVFVPWLCVSLPTV